METGFRETKIFETTEVNLSDHVMGKHSQRDIFLVSLFLLAVGVYRLGKFQGFDSFEES